MTVRALSKRTGAALRSFLLCWAVLAASLAHAEEVTDLAGRTVTIEKPAETIVVGDGRILSAIALLDRKDPLHRVKALLSDLRLTDGDLLSTLSRHFERMKTLPIYAGKGDSVSAETIISLAPDAAVFGLQDHGPGASNTELIAQLEEAGTTVVFIDFRQHPMENTVPSIILLGKLLGREDEAREYTDFYEAHRARIAERVAGFTGERPTVFLHAHPGRFDCCVGMANGMLGPFVTLAGGRNISAAVTPAVVGRHTLEFVLAEDPDVWIGTASGSLEDFEAGRPIVVLGTKSNGEIAHASLQAALEADGLEALSAVQAGRAHAIWHNFYNSPLNIYALESFAKWIHPHLFADLDPDETLAEIHRRFLGYPLNGLYSVSLGDE
ncbi:ABC transporter substrate-binding protein [Rhodobium gokarnense]|uniref:Iron complex transport system substrate-binding protein n=1 Tax=Rhodobium gokarnense TaxID=364296 RepID=A0ABT3HBB4_9HYPH|nr:ABC transporter substrate-binding protein [Rhodobium gokarnense]MCW2307692.1 iron complex transport system substrate-binding protein [Rhodobium gokarnense]